MSSSSEPTKRRECSVADALALVGDRYTLLIVRELAYGYTRFTDLRAYTGAPRHLLASRLRMLEDAGLVTREPYSTRPPRHGYRLTEAGADLVPIVLSLKDWGDRHLHDGAQRAVFEHSSCGHELHLRAVCAACSAEVSADQVRTTDRGTHPPLDVRASEA